jgi:hypothetical protein
MTESHMKIEQNSEITGMKTIRILPAKCLWKISEFEGRTHICGMRFERTTPCIKGKASLAYELEGSVCVRIMNRFGTEMSD